MSSDLKKLRSEISKIDQGILELLSKRKDISKAVAGDKEKNQQEIRDEQREQEVVLSALEKARDLGLDTHYISSIFKEIISDSNRVQRSILQQALNPELQQNSIKVACQKSYTKYSAEAAKIHFIDKQVNFDLTGTVRDVLAEVKSGRSDYGLLPIENTIAGANNEVYDILLNSQLSIVGEVKVAVDLCLVANKGQNIKNIKEVYCHPRDVLLCNNFLIDHGLKIKYLAEDENSVSKVRELNCPSVAGLTGKLEDNLTDISIIVDDIANQEHVNFRFILVGRKPVEVDVRVPAKTSIVICTKQVPGALADTLNIFKDHNINLAKLESRPVPGNNWEEMFYLDFFGNAKDERVRLALEEVGRNAKFVKVLGCYPVADVEAVKVSLPHQENLEADVKEVVIQPSKKSNHTSSRDHKSEDTIIDINGVKIGGDSNFVVMSGPCSVESYDQIMSCAEHANRIGSQILRGGCFKPRTSPYSFQGLGYEGLDMLLEAGNKYDMPIITEVMAPGEVQKVAEKSHILQIGARNMQNFDLLKEVGQTQRPVLLKRGMSNTITDMMDAAEYILAGGNMQVMFCERGIRTFENATRFTLDLSAVPVLRERSHLPVIIDPSHAAGVRRLVPALAIASKAVGAHGIIVEFHPNPEKALSDGPQALRFAQMEKLMRDLEKVPSADYSA